ncbi:MAG TPA: 4-hydroxythreonine-4-phosphate dehydrogenase PdxA [Candidatus Ratteibacteria bacterium]|nr:4-hydroxythreonine-4-phosphate dehydrogenase PdxA [Candidatus Ratteibacteria bacterium]
MKIIGITLGDPAGIGGEIFLKGNDEIKKIKNSFPVLIGDRTVLERNAIVLNKKINIKEIKDKSQLDKNCINIFSVNFIKEKNYPIGKNSKICGLSSFKYIEFAIDLWKKNQIDALVTLPISKKAWEKAGIKYPGHTELLSEKFNARKTAMIMVADKIRTVLATTHISLKEVIGKLSVQLIVEKVKNGIEFLEKLKIKNPVIGISGLNPHAGEEGLMGDEEIRIIKPAIKKLRKQGINCIGPIVPDAIFRKNIEGEISLIVSMYHDQALIPLKTFYFEKLVNFTSGIPMIRTSPGHGTAFDIAYKNKGNPSSFIESYKLAVKLCDQKVQRKSK